MALIDHYPLVKHAHVGLVYLSGSLFALRGLGAIAGMRWPRALPLRVGSVLIDTALVIAALALLAMLQLNPLTTPWLLVKLVLLAAYVGLGVQVFKRERDPGRRLGWWLLALACFGFMITVARAHHPLGVLARWMA